MAHPQESGEGVGGRSQQLKGRLGRAGLLRSLARRRWDGEEAGARDAGPGGAAGRQDLVGNSLGLRCSRRSLELESGASFPGESCLHKWALPRGPDLGPADTGR